MKTTLVIFLCTAFYYTAFTQEYYPLKISNKWCYYRNYPPNYPDTSTVRVIADTMIINGLRYYTLSQSDISGERFVHADSLSIRYWSPSWHADYPIFNLKSSVGDSSFGFFPGFTYLKSIDTLLILGKLSIVRTYHVTLETSKQFEVKYSNIFGPLNQWIYGGDPPAEFPSTMDLIGCMISDSVYGFTTSVKNLLDSPVEYSLFQNYPNPFNSTTTISYSLSKQSDVNFVIVNILGQVIWKINIPNQIAGYHLLKWSGDSFSSGIYFLNLLVNHRTLTRRMLMLK